ncbi:hypothetical protein, partial [Alistipes finegoldii]|uniref:hypothetical protein n=3 Tax=Alistipes TaxID=239759 RepID=UPI00248CEB35
GDTRIFSPLLYQLSYGTIPISWLGILLSVLSWCKGKNSFSNLQMPAAFFLLFSVAETSHALPRLHKKREEPSMLLPPLDQ